MLAAKERLGQLLGLAAARQWSALARELGDLVLYWPPDYPDAMRPLIMALFETALREADGETQNLMASRMAGRSDIPLKLMNVLYLAAPAPLRREILLRNALESDTTSALAIDGPAILAAARSRNGDFTGTLARLTGLPRRVVTAILTDPSGEPLAVLCRGTNLDRASFSALALLRGPEGMPLAVFDTVAPKAAAHLLADWRKTGEHTMQESIRAAE